MTVISSCFTCCCQNNPQEGDEPNLTPIGHQGIDNLGNTCYMAATLQPLFALYKDHLMGMGTTELATSIRALLQAITDPHTEKDKIKPLVTNLYEKIQQSEAEGGIAWPYPTGTQQDAVELLEKLLAWMEVPPIHVHNQLYHPDRIQKRDVPPDTNNILQVIFRSPHTDVHSMQSLFNDALQNEEIEVKWKDGDVGSITVTKKKTIKCLNRLYNNVLVVQLKRFDPVNLTKKIQTDVSNPFELIITPAQSSELTDNRSYQLVSFIHHGGSVGGGHYMAYVKHGSQWVHYDDATARQISDDEAKKQARQGYVFFYQPTAPNPQEGG